MLYERGRYRVEVASDGAIKVQSGDWLTKYSAAIYDDFTMIDVFIRLDRSGNMVLIENPNLIYAGETLYHLPTWERHQRGPSGQPPPPPPKKEFSDKEKKLIEETLKHEFNLSGEHLSSARKYIGIISRLNAGAGSAAILTEIMIATKATAVASAVTGIAGPFLLVAAATIDLANNGEFGERLAGLRAVAYGMTAWAFGHKMPSFPDAMRNNLLRSGAHQAHPRNRPMITRYVNAWNKARDSAVLNLESQVRKTGRQKLGLQIQYRALGDDHPRTLARTLMKGLEQRLSPAVERQAFWNPEPNYPL